jgi:hypothetical protein
MRGAKTLAILANAAAVASLMACGGGNSAPKPTLTPDQIAQMLPLTSESEHFTYHYADALPVDRISQEAFYSWMAPQLGVSPTQKIQYYRFAYAGQIQIATGHLTDGYADTANFAVDTVNAWENHEVVHLLTFLIGPSTDFFGEGFAVANTVDPANHDLTPKRHGTPVHDVARGYLKNGQLPRVTDIVVSDAFQHSGSPGEINYDAAGSFVEYLIEKYGIEKSLNLFRSMNRDMTFSAIDVRFQQIYGIPLSQADSDWHAFLTQ